MYETEEERITAKLAKVMAIMCVRNTALETLHAGVVPVTKAGDYSDVTVVDADGRKISWADVSHIDDDAMGDLMRQIVERLFTFHMKIDDADFQERVNRWASVAQKWDNPELDQAFLQVVKKAPV